MATPNWPTLPPPPPLSFIDRISEKQKTLVLFACTTVLFAKLSKVFNPCANVEKKNTQDKNSRKL
jgi:hypothetical protein